MFAELHQSHRSNLTQYGYVNGTTKHLDINKNIAFKMFLWKNRNIPLKEDDPACLRSSRGLAEVGLISLDGTSGVGGGIGGTGQRETLLYLLLTPPSGSLSESVSPNICLTNQNVCAWLKKVNILLQQ